MTEDDFNHIEHPILRAWNRWVTAGQMYMAGNTEGAQAYLLQFDDVEKLKIGYINNLVLKRSYEGAVIWVQEHAKFEEDEADTDGPSQDMLVWGEAVSFKTADKELNNE